MTNLEKCRGKGKIGSGKLYGSEEQEKEEDKLNDMHSQEYVTKYG